MYYGNKISSFLFVAASNVVRPTQPSVVQLGTVNGVQFCPFVLKCSFNVVDAIQVELLKNTTDSGMTTVFLYTVSINQWTLSGDLQVSFICLVDRIQNVRLQLQVNDATLTAISKS